MKNRQAMVQIGLPGVTLKDLIQSGIIKSGTKLFSPTNNAIGQIDDSGSITITINGKSQIFYSPSGAARAIEKKSINGWIYWQLIDSHSNSLENLSFFREKHLNKNR